MIVFCEDVQIEPSAKSGLSINSPHRPNGRYMSCVARYSVLCDGNVG